MSFLNIATFDAVELLSKWCALNDIALLDSALTSSHHRELFLRLLGLGEFTTESENIFRVLIETGVYDRKGQESLDIWTLLRGLKVTPQCHATFTNNSIPQFDMLSLKSIYIDFCGFGSPNFSIEETINSCPNLTCIQLRNVKCKGFTVNQIDPVILKQLKRFTIDGCRNSICAWDLVGLCSSLEVIPGELYEDLFHIYNERIFEYGYFDKNSGWRVKLSDNNKHNFIPPDSPTLKDDEYYFGDSDDETQRDHSCLHKHILNFLKHMPNITAIDVNNENIMVDDLFFLAISRNCPHFRKLYITCILKETDFHSITTLFIACKNLESFDIVNIEFAGEAYFVKYRANDLIYGKFIEINRARIFEDFNTMGRLVLFFTYVTDFNSIFLINVKDNDSEFICDYDIGGKIILAIVASNPDLSGLHINSLRADYTVHDMKGLLEHCAQLHTLTLNHREPLRNSQLCELFSVLNYSLTDLNLCMNNKLTTATVLHILDHCPNVRTLGVDLCYKVCYGQVSVFVAEHDRLLTVRTSQPYVVTAQDIQAAITAAEEVLDTSTLCNYGGSYLTLDCECCGSLHTYSNESDQED